MTAARGDTTPEESWELHVKHYIGQDLAPADTKRRSHGLVNKRRPIIIQQRPVHIAHDCLLRCIAESLRQRCT